MKRLFDLIIENKGILLAFFIRGTGMCFGLISGILLARLLDSENYGLYALSMAWLTTLSLICTKGYDVSTLRYIGIYKDQKKDNHIKAFLQQAKKESFIISFIIICLLLPISFFFLNDLFTIILCVLIALPLFSYLLIRMATLRAYGEYVLAIGADNLLRNLLLVIVFGTILFLSIPIIVTTLHPLLVIIGATLLAIIFVEFRLYFFLKSHKNVTAHEDKSSKKEWTKSSITLMFISMSRLILGKIDMAILPLFVALAYAGIYDAAIKWAGLIWFVQNTLVRVFGPQLAALHAKGDKNNLDQHIKKISLFIAFPSFLIALILYLLGPFLMALYGAEFTKGVTTLNILILGYSFTALCGSAHLVINMLGDEKTSLNISIQTVICNLILNAIFIPLYGMEGAAIATSLSLVYMSLKRVYFLYQKHDINCLPIKVF